MARDMAMGVIRTIVAFMLVMMKKIRIGPLIQWRVGQA